MYNPKTMLILNMFIYKSLYETFFIFFQDIIVV
jgi:hypothetical protein